MSATAVGRLPGRAGEVLATLDRPYTVHDLYDAVGAPVYHDLAAHDTSEIRELLGLVRRVPGPVLELAAGSGRLTLPLLALGREVTALELSGAMFALLEQQLATMPERARQRCTPVRADMTTFSLGRRFPVIVLGTTSISLLDEVGRGRLGRAVRSHLAPGGRFLLSTVELVDAGPEASDLEVEAVGVSGRRYHMYEHWPTGSLTRAVTIVSEADGDAPVTVCTTTIGVLPAEMIERELADVGLTVRGRVPLDVSRGLRHRDVLLELEAA